MDKIRVRRRRISRRTVARKQTRCGRRVAGHAGKSSQTTAPREARSGGGIAEDAVGPLGSGPEIVESCLRKCRIDGRVPANGRNLITKSQNVWGGEFAGGHPKMDII